MPLTILICGAGIVGLAAAIPLSVTGHTVHLFEKSRFSAEIGAAFHFGPYATRILKRWGVDIATMRPSICETWKYFDLDCNVMMEKFELRKKQRETNIEEDQIMIHRIDAHTCLREHALKSPNVHLHLASGVESVDAAAGTITLRDGSVHTGDVVVGADGVHSTIVRTVAGDDCPTRRTGINMYRFMVPTATAREDPLVNALLDKVRIETSMAQFWEPVEEKGGRMGPPGRGLVLYPCRVGSLLNLATFQRAKMGKVQLTSEWNNPGTVQEVLDAFEGWPEVYMRLMSMAEDVKHWAVVARDVAPTFVKDKLVLIGDAAHPTQPTHSAGASIGIEDAGVLGVLLDADADSSNLNERLMLFNELRYERTVSVKYASEILPGKPETKIDLLRRYVPEGNIPTDIEAYLWKIDVMEEAKEALHNNFPADKSIQG